MSIRGGKILSTTVTIVGILISLVLVIIGLKMGGVYLPETLQMFLRGAGLYRWFLWGFRWCRSCFPLSQAG